MSDNDATFKVEEAKATSKEEDGCAITISKEEDICAVCYKTIDIYSIGECDHSVCYECSTRMRVLCEQTECPICRRALPKVIFTQKNVPHRELVSISDSNYYVKKYGIVFDTAKTQKNFYELLNNRCPECTSSTFDTFQQLHMHMRRNHDLHYCNICAQHLKLFPFERKCYTQEALERHYIQGDADNTSHRGHPMCKYCNSHYVDREELYRHLKRTHYSCHICDADGRNVFYKDYEALTKHFREEHYLCEMDQCANKEFTAVFRREVQYKAHLAEFHKISLSKEQLEMLKLRANYQIDVHCEQEFPTLPGIVSASNGPLVRPNLAAQHDRTNGPSTSMSTYNQIQQNSTTDRFSINMSTSVVGNHKFQQNSKTNRPSTNRSTSVLGSNQIQQNSRTNWSPISVSTSVAGHNQIQQNFDAKQKRYPPCIKEETFSKEFPSLSTVAAPSAPSDGTPASFSYASLLKMEHRDQVEEQIKPNLTMEDFIILDGSRKIKTNKRIAAANCSKHSTMRKKTQNKGTNETKTSTKTNSMGENDIPDYSYIPPTDVVQRNQKLYIYFEKYLETEKVFEEFLSISQLYKDGNYKPEEYYEYCQKALQNKFNNTFHEMLCLLPDISKQQALYTIHQEYLNTLSSEERKILPKLQVCSICQQVLVQQDWDNHQKMHEFKENFPPLKVSHDHWEHHSDQPSSSKEYR